jgi:MFS family permease
LIIGTGLQAGAVNYAMMIVARIFTGIFNGLLTSTVSVPTAIYADSRLILQVPTYQSECAKPHRRGQLLLLSGSLITFVSNLPVRS